MSLGYYMDRFYSALGDYLSSHIGVTELFIICLTIGIVFLALIPKAFQIYLMWKTDHKPTHFSMAIILGAISLILLASTYPAFISEVVKINGFLPSTFYRMLIFAALIFFMGYLSLPKMLLYYQKLKIKKSASLFSGMCFFAFLSLSCMSIFFILILNPVISSMR